jgi:hypothetical protein
MLKRSGNYLFAALCVAASLLIISTAGCALMNSPDNIQIRSALYNLKITEINYHPAGEGSVAGDEYEFIELKNAGDSSIDLSNVAFTNGIEYNFPSGTVVATGKFIVIAANSSYFSARYGFAPFGVYTGKLSNSGEKISLKDLTAGKVFLSVEYSTTNPWPSSADGGGKSLVPVTSEASGDPSDASYWRASFKNNGSPDADDPGVVYVNEVLSNPTSSGSDAIELYNPNSFAVNISGWLLSDSKVNPVKYSIPSGTIIEANGYKVFYESDFNSSNKGFDLSSHGDTVCLFSDSMGTLNGNYYHEVTFGEIESGNSFGRYVTSDGEEQFVEQKSVTLGAANSGPHVGAVVISEIMYNPKNGRDEYIEIKNTGTETKTLYDESNPSNTWKIGGIDFTFPANTSIVGGGIILVVSNAIDTATFRTTYSIPAGVQIFSKSVDLANSGDTVSLLKPETPYTEGTATITPYMVCESIIFSDASPWPEKADGTGSSLQRINFDKYGNDPANWKSASGTPGK